jgi:selenocysteine-specific elongation factor
VSKAIVALNKIDAVDDPEQIEIVRDEIGELLEKHGIQLIELVPVSATKNIGIKELKEVLSKRLVGLPARDTAGGAFLPVDRVFTKSGFGTVITGTLVRGKLAVGDQIVVGPDVSPGRVRRLETFGHQVETAGAGQRVACNLVLKETNKHLTRGHIVLGHDVPSTKSLIVSLVDRPRIAGEKFAQRVSEQPVRLYHGTAEHHGYIRWADETDIDSTNVNVAAAFHAAGSTSEAHAVALIVLNEPAMAEPGDRFVVRLSDESIFGGQIVLRDKPRWLKRANAASVAHKVLEGDLAAATIMFVESAPHKLVKRNLLPLFLPMSQADAISNPLIAAGKLSVIGEMIMSGDTRRDLSKQLVESVDHVVKMQVQSGDVNLGATLETVRGLVKPRLDRTTFQALVDEETAGGHVTRSGDKLMPPGGAAAPSADAASNPLLEKISSAVNTNFCLDLNDLSAMFPADQAKIKNAVQLLAKNGTIVLINYEFAISHENLHKAHVVLADIWQKKRNIAPTDFRESLNTTRKYAMALLQHFDDNKITRRLPSGRVLLKPPK